MLLPGTRFLASSLPLLLLKTDIQTRRKELERAADAPGPLPACSQGRPPGDSDPAPSASTLHFTPGAEWRKRLQIYCSFFSQDQEVGRREWSKMAVPKSSSSQLESRRSSSDPTSGVSRPTAGRSVLPVFSLISHRTLKSAGFILWQLRACFLKNK